MAIKIEKAATSQIQAFFFRVCAIRSDMFQLPCRVRIQNPVAGTAERRDRRRFALGTLNIGLCVTPVNNRLLTIDFFVKPLRVVGVNL